MSNRLYPEESLAVRGWITSPDRPSTLIMQVNGPVLTFSKVKFVDVMAPVMQLGTWADYVRMIGSRSLGSPTSITVGNAAK